MKHYTHLTPPEREKILCALSQRTSISQIARELGQNKYTISREIRTNRNRVRKLASTVSTLLLSLKKSTSKIESVARGPQRGLVPKLRERSQELFLEKNWSPEQISERLSFENSTYRISAATIYCTTTPGC